MNAPKYSPAQGTALPPATFRHLTIASGVRAAAQRDPQKIALRMGELQISYAQFVRAINRVANVGTHLGVKAGDNVAIVAPNCMEYMEIVAGISELGAAVATPNPKLSAPELAAICNDAKADVAFVHAACMSSFDPALLNRPIRIVEIGAQYEALKVRASDRFEDRKVSEWQTFSIPYTSGTTGKPKGVMLPHRSRSLGFLAYAAEYGIYSPDDYFLAITPMCHGAGFAYAYASLFLGGTTEIMSRFDPEEVLRAIHTRRVTGFFSVPTHYHGFFQLEKRLLSSLRGHRLKGIVANAAPLSQDMKALIVDYFGAGLLHETYGSTEAGVVTNLRPADQLRKTKCVGLPFVGNQVRLLNEQGQETNPDEVGELFSSSPYLFNGYWRKDAETAQAFRDGWVTVGDMAKRDEEGYLYIVDRKKDMVISGGLNVYPREVETVLDSHPAIAESAVIGVPDSRWGEQLLAYVVVAPGQTLVKDDLFAFMRSRIAPFKLPKEFLIIDSLPRNASGKLLKTTLREKFAEEVALKG